MKRLLLDTNHRGQAIDADSPLRARITNTRESGFRLGTCTPVVCELAVGLAQTRRRAENWSELELLLRQVRVWPIELEVAREYAEIHQELRAKGRVLSQVDMMVAALARTLDATVLTTDRDFEAVEGIRVDNWVSG